MDPDTCLKEMLDLADAIANSEVVDPVAAHDLAERVLGLDHWLTAVGYLPAAWAYGR